MQWAFPAKVAGGHISRKTRAPRRKAEGKAFLGPADLQIGSLGLYCPPCWRRPVGRNRDEIRAEEVLGGFGTADCIGLGEHPRAQTRSGTPPSGPRSGSGTAELAARHRSPEHLAPWPGRVTRITCHKSCFSDYKARPR